GGRLYSATFTYNPATSATPSNTLRHLITFLAGAVDDFASIANVDAIEAETTRILRNTGIMGLAKIAGKVSTGHRDTGPGATGDSAFDVPIETAGAFTRSYAGVVDYNGDGVPEPAGANPGIPDPGSGDSFNISIVSNLGAENAITDIEIIYNNVKYSDFFKPDITYSQIQGGSDSTNMVAYDSLGNPKRLNLQLSLVARDTNFSTWRWIADSRDDTDADFQFNSAGTAITTSLNVGTGVIRFDAEGRFVNGAEFSESDGIEITLDNQGVNSPLTIRLRRGLATGETQDLDFSPMTQVAAESDFNLKSQDGTPPGTLDSFTVTADGVIQGIFSNGVVEPIARLVLALVPNETGMISLGNNLFLEGPASGKAAINFAATGGRGWIRAGQLEASNVDLSEEFTKLITTQRGFQANARVITTSDEMLVELVNMKR
ncbi:MAG: flagellar hook-basal body complex protein, partial [Planctomycetota bacterium]|nr:flagellar hook-basal body complex protein [Planctomycetota bacterium]